MRAAAFLLMGLLVSGCLCIRQQQPPAPAPEANSSVIDDLFREVLEDVETNVSYAAPAQATTTTGQTSTTTTLRATTTTEPRATTTTTPASATTTLKATTTTVEAQTTLECAKIQHPMTPEDCKKGQCTASGATCSFFPGNLYRSAKCVCMIRK